MVMGPGVSDYRAHFCVNGRAAAWFGKISQISIMPGAWTHAKPALWEQPIHL